MEGIKRLLLFMMTLGVILIPVHGVDYVCTSYDRDVCMTNQWDERNYPCPSDCSIYISCSNYDTHVMPCPGGLFFDSEQRECVWPWMHSSCAETSATNEPTTEGSTTTVKPTLTTTTTEPTTTTTIPTTTVETTTTPTTTTESTTTPTTTTESTTTPTTTTESTTTPTTTTPTTTTPTTTTPTTTTPTTTTPTTTTESTTTPTTTTPTTTTPTTTTPTTTTPTTTTPTTTTPTTTTETTTTPTTTTESTTTPTTTTESTTTPTTTTTTTTPTTTTTVPSCVPAGGLMGISTTYEDRVLTLVKLPELSWEDAAAECERQCLVLATVEDANQLQHMINFMSSNGILWGWVGGHADPSAEGSPFTWIEDGSPVGQIWGSGKPDNIGGMEYCAEIYNELNDYRCSFLSHFWCSTRKEIAPQETTIVPDDCSPEAYSAFEEYQTMTIGDTVYIAVSNPTNQWSEAQEACRCAWGGHLVTLHQETDKVNIEELMSQAGAEWAWVGGHRAEDGNFYWVEDGSPIEDWFWAADRPDNAGGVEDCTELYVGGNDFLCGYSSPFICERKISMKSEDCEDTHGKCEEWSLNGDCETNDWMKINCKKSCGRCDNPCADILPDCASLTANGECNDLSTCTYLQSHCPYSCGKCVPHSE